ncbi:MAG: DUF2269 family protein [Alphaproteobacteria bacterium]
MSDPYLWLKWLHVVSATVLFGTGLGTALHMWLTHLRRDPRAIAVVARNVVLVDWLFTATSGVVQPVSGFVLTYLAAADPFESWLVVSYVLYAIAAMCWFPVVWLQTRVRAIAVAAVANETPLPPEYDRRMRAWFWLGWPAFLSLLAIFALMVMRPTLW